ncbi:hypothetical protein CH377_19590, partial [Leptospira haakeii]
ANATGKFVVKTDSGKAAILWENGADVYIAFRDLAAANFPAIGSEIKVVTRTNSPGLIGLAMGGGGKALAFWSTYSVVPYVTTYHTVYGRLFQGDVAGTAGTQFTVFSGNANGLNCQFSADSDGGNNGIVAVGYGASTNIVNAYSYDFATGTKQAGPIALTGTATGGGYVGSINVSASSGKAFVTWKRSD